MLVSSYKLSTLTNNISLILLFKVNQSFIDHKVIRLKKYTSHN